MLFHMNKRRKWFICTGLLCLALMLWGCGKRTETEPVTAEFFAMDTYMTMTAYGSQAAEALDEAEKKIHQLDDLLSTGNPDSEISVLNRDKKLAVSDETYELIRRAGEYYADTGGVFDISVYPIMRAWGFTDGNYRVPSGEELKSLLTHVHGDKILCEDQGNQVTLEDPEMEIDLGGIAKGYTSDLVMDILREHGVEHALINLGGNVRTLGDKPDGSDWSIGIADPSDNEAYVGGVRMRDKAAITSGGYQRYFEQDGKTYIHIIDLSSGYPADSGLKSVTIIAEDGTMADALSTSLFIMGPEKAADYWRENADLFDVIFVDEDGTVLVTEGLEDSYFSDHDFRVIRR